MFFPHTSPLCICHKQPICTLCFQLAQILIRWKTIRLFSFLCIRLKGLPKGLKPPLSFSSLAIHSCTATWTIPLHGSVYGCRHRFVDSFRYLPPSAQTALCCPFVNWYPLSVLYWVNCWSVLYVSGSYCPHAFL